MADAVTTCAACRHFERYGTEGLCRRHAPSASDSPFEVARWPETRAIDGCGEGEPKPGEADALDRAEDGAERPACRVCLYWFRPGIGIDPSQRGDHLRAWWQQAGYCRRYAPQPGVDIGRHGFWRVTHGSERCAEMRRA